MPLATSLYDWLLDLIDEFRLMIDPLLVGGSSDSSPTTALSVRCSSSRTR
jgi:hypothetical protein